MLTRIFHSLWCKRKFVESKRPWKCLLSTWLFIISSCILKAHRCIETEDFTQTKRFSFVSFQILDDHYHFEHKTLVKRSISPSHHHQRRLDDDDRVVWSKQQRAKSRQKRDFTRLKPLKSFTSLLNDPKWPSMWYLVSTYNSFNNSQHSKNFTPLNPL